MARVSEGDWEFSPFGELTPELVEALTDEARRGYDPVELRLQFVGRPAYELREPLPPRISFRVPPELLAAAQKRADEEERALSDLAAEALRRYLEAAGAVRETSGWS
jgi:predicted HicB family RNase H-like nuclease